MTGNISLRQTSVFQSKLVKSLTLLGLWFITTVAVSLQAKADLLQPVTALQFPQKKTDLHMSDLMRDPMISHEHITREAAKTNLKALQKRLNSGKKMSARYLADALDTSLESLYALESTAKKSSNVDSARSIVIKIANKTLKSKATRFTKARAAYHSRSQSFLRDPSSNSNRLRLMKLLKAKRLNSTLKKKIALVGDYHVLVATSPSNKSRHQNAVANLRNQLNSSSLETRIAMGLAIGKSLAGLDSSNTMVTEPEQRYQSYLGETLEDAASLDTKDALSVISEIYRISAKVSLTTKAQSPFPFSIAAVGQISNKHAIALQERNALFAWKMGNKSETIATYKRLSAGAQGRQQVKFDRKLIDLNIAHYKQTKKSHLLLKELDRQISLYARNQGEARTHKDYIIQLKRAVVVSLMKTAMKKSTQAKRTALNLSAKHLALVPADYTLVKPLEAKLYHQMKEFNHAVAIYSALASKTQKVTYWDLAIRSQAQKIGWPLKTAPWFKKVNVPSQANALTLAKLFASRKKLAKPSWPLLSHESLALNAAGKTSLAAKLWETSIKADPKHQHAQYAAGSLLKLSKSRSLWKKLESLSRFMLKAGMTPEFNFKRSNPKTYLADSLYHQGKALLAKREHSQAREKLEELVKKLQHPKMDHALFMLAEAYRGELNSPQAIQTLRLLVDRFPQSKWIRPALLKGKEYSIEIAYLDNAVFFLSQFIKRFPSDGSVAVVRSELIEVYMGKGIYGSAIEQTLALAEEMPDDRRALQTKAVRMELKYGESSSALKRCQRLLSGSILCEEIRAKNLAKSDSIKDVQKLMNAQNTNGSETIAESKAQIYIRYAQSQQDKLLVSPDALSLTDPENELRKHYGAFKKVEATYRKVCTQGSASYCAQAKHEIARLAEQIIPTMEEYTIADTLDRRTVEKFAKSKAGIIDALKKTAIESDKGSLATIKSSFTHPTVTQEILWQNGKDWNFHPVSSEPGNGYLEWKVKK